MYMRVYLGNGRQPTKTHQQLAILKEETTHYYMMIVRDGADEIDARAECRWPVRSQV